MNAKWCRVVRWEIFLLTAVAGCVRSTSVGPIKLEVSAGEDLTVEEGEALTLSADVGGRTEGYAFRWSQESGPETEIADPTSPVTEAGPFSEAGDYKFRVIVSNASAAFGQDFVVVSVEPAEENDNENGDEEENENAEEDADEDSDGEANENAAEEADANDGEDADENGDQADGENANQDGDADENENADADADANENGEVEPNENEADMTEDLMVELEGDRENLALVGKSSTLTIAAANFDEADLEYTWQVVSGDATLEDASSPTPVVTVNSPGTVELEVTAGGVIEDLERQGRMTVFVTALRDLRPQVVIEVEGFGEIPIELNAEAAPVTVANFLHYVDDAHYDGQIFHRVIAEFVIQAGGFDAERNPIESRDPIPNEADNGLSNVRGTVSMALLSGQPDSGTQGFFINLTDDNVFLDDMQHTVFGTVIADGMEVVDRIAAVDTEPDDFPAEPVVINSIRRVETGQEDGE